jgi:hypothetical protein
MGVMKNQKNPPPPALKKKDKNPLAQALKANLKRRKATQK